MVEREGGEGESEMNLLRRQFLYLAVGAATLPTLSLTARAQTYPTRPVRWIVGFPPGGGADTVARIVGPWLSERLGQQVIIENRPGASTNIAAQAVINSPPDGYTLLFYGASTVINTSIFHNLPFDVQRDIAPVSGLVAYPMVLVANPSVAAKSVAELFFSPLSSSINVAVAPNLMVSPESFDTSITSTRASLSSSSAIRASLISWSALAA
jgi:tripartite-type tricarboxylate transporter receptor subunit TctC